MLQKLSSALASTSSRALAPSGPEKSGDCCPSKKDLKERQQGAALPQDSFQRMDRTDDLDLRRMRAMLDAPMNPL
ncbi:hypothetical protein OWM54_19445 [Myxococcus sp. MISCRS1]|jgi:hypothetical protein|uniref:hypothetical protein n=1 Tax=Myxococcus sp. MISCRS1 TaxID=2996786 RepID=UPI002270D4CB|nr:hypothetical protein [Myxococcus sp. MISCRS1]MCY0999315.1 hypothetical protein [Myxococcus sp. MISCRS1]BDT30685.1 hypothetical protein MFMH1_03540 [Myxococcus sp. MH1]